MREIKFRMWSGSKMYISNVMECLKQQMAFDYDDKSIPGYDHVGKHKSSFMQYTGLKDKNGKEIYEGDIVKSPNGIIDVVGFENGYFSWQNEPLVFDSGECYDTDLWAEVIGNIYETADLLKANVNQ